MAEMKENLKQNIDKNENQLIENNEVDDFLKKNDSEALSKL